LLAEIVTRLRGRNTGRLNLLVYLNPAHRAEPRVLR
jgi:hypothetical protein